MKHSFFFDLEQQFQDPNFFLWYLMNCILLYWNLSHIYKHKMLDPTHQGQLIKKIQYFIIEFNPFFQLYLVSNFYSSFVIYNIDYALFNIVLLFGQYYKHCNIINQYVMETEIFQINSDTAQKILSHTIESLLFNTSVVCLVYYFLNPLPIAYRFLLTSKVIH